MKNEDFGFFRAQAVCPRVQVGDVTFHTHRICQAYTEAAAQGVDVLCLPELCLTGYTCADLFGQRSLLNGTLRALAQLTALTTGQPTALAVGLPLELDGQLYNCAAFLANGKVQGIVPKIFLPNYNEFYERRWFSPADTLRISGVDSAAWQPEGEHYTVPVGTDLIFSWHGGTIGIELCEDLWAPLPPSTLLALGGADLILNLSASNETIGKQAYRRQLVVGQSGRCLCGYLYASAAAGESTTDLVFSGHLLAAENGSLLAENTDLPAESGCITVDFDLQRLRTERRRVRTFGESAARYATPLRRVTVCGDSGVSAGDGSLLPLSRLPFVPTQKNQRLNRCQAIFDLQVAGLVKRLQVTRAKPVIGISGGLDSTLALLVAVQAMRKMQRPVSDVVGITMPCFGTTDRTYTNALTLMQTLGITCREIPIRQAVRTHFADIGHEEAVTDVTYENCQARERTQVLMDVAGEVGGLVVGTGDLSELALGWCTYNADHMSMYGVNASIPKTLVRWMIDSLVETDCFPASTRVLRDVLDTPISPELLPPDAEGKIAQQTEEIVGPYALHDFFLFYVLRCGFTPTKIYTLARRAFAGDFSDEVILHWLTTFYRRFFTQQFKRSCLPDGVKVGSVCLSPRGDWRMPSDATSALWLEEIKELSAR